MKAFRIFGRSIRDSFKSVFRNFSLSVASIACTTITLILVSVALIVSHNVNNVTQKLESELSIIVYLNKTFIHHEITTITIAAYTFTSLTFAIINFIKYKKYDRFGCDF